MNTFQAMKLRRSIRRYKNKTVEVDDLMMLTEMGMLAPSSGDLQEMRFIVIREREKIEKVAAMCMEQLWMTSAPALIVVCSQPKEQAEWYGERGRHVFATQNAAAAIQNILLAATDMGLATCWIGGYDQREMDDFLGTEGKARVEGIITVGYADETPDEKQTYSVLQSVYFEKYGNAKSDLVALNKDYSIKLEKKLKDVDKAADVAREKTKSFIEKAKEAHKKYILKK